MTWSLLLASDTDSDRSIECCGGKRSIFHRLLVLGLFHNYSLTVDSSHTYIHYHRLKQLSLSITRWQSRTW